MPNDRIRRWKETIPEEIETRIERPLIQDDADGTHVGKEDTNNAVAYRDIVYYLLLEDNTILSDTCTQRDIKREFEVSKTTATNNLNRLAEWGVLTADTDREPYEYELNTDLLTPNNPPSTSTNATTPVSREESTENATQENELLAGRLLATLASLTTSVSTLIETERPNERTLVLTTIWLLAVVSALTQWMSILPALLTAPIVWGLYTLARNHRHTTPIQLLENTKNE